MRQHDQQSQDDQQAAHTPVQVDDRDWPDDPDRADEPDRMNGRDRDGGADRVDDLDRTDNPDRTDDLDLVDDPDRAGTRDRSDDPDPVDALDRKDDLDQFGRRDRNDDLDRVEYHEPAPLPTSFGAPTAGGAVAASALASGNRADEFDAREEETVGPDNGRADGRTTLDTPTTDPATAATTPAATTPDTAAAVPMAPDTAAMGTAVPGTVAAGNGDGGGDGVGPLLDQETTAGLRDRWRDVQLRFVDDPQAALGEARGLVGEAVESLTSALAAQRDKLDHDGDDGTGNDDGGETERIRLSIRRYRDFLDRVLAH
jgi:hypothetical protein